MPEETLEKDGSPIEPYYLAEDEQFSLFSVDREAWYERWGWPPSDPRCYARIRPDMRKKLEQWGAGKHPYPFGDFLNALLRGRRLGVLTALADDSNLRALAAFGSFLSNKVPANCHGSDENVDEWMMRTAEGTLVRLCECGHPEAEHKSELGCCHQLSAWLCPCDEFEPVTEVNVP